MIKDLTFENYFTWTFNQHVGKIGNPETISAFMTAIIQFGHDEIMEKRLHILWGRMVF